MVGIQAAGKHTGASGRIQHVDLAGEYSTVHLFQKLFTHFAVTAGGAVVPAPGPFDPVCGYMGHRPARIMEASMGIPERLVGGDRNKHSGLPSLLHHLAWGYHGDLSSHGGSQYSVLPGVVAVGDVRVGHSVGTEASTRTLY